MKKNSKTITDEFSNFSTKSQGKPTKIESDRGAEWYFPIFQDFLKSKEIQQCSRFSDKGPSVVERVIRTVRNLLKKTILLAGNADWISEPPSVIEKYI